MAGPTDAEPDLAASPAQNVLRLRELAGADAVAEWCAGLLSRRIAYDDPHAPSLAWLGGAPASHELRRGHLVERDMDYWPRVWAARGLLHAYLPSARNAIVGSLDDPAWRVREMAAKVVRRGKSRRCRASLALDESAAGPAAVSVPQAAAPERERRLSRWCEEGKVLVL
ncbi:MAG: hypothetical protein ACR2KJ_05305 [Jatrophihabitans sp.]